MQEVFQRNGNNATDALLIHVLFPYSRLNPWHSTTAELFTLCLYTKAAAYQHDHA